MKAAVLIACVIAGCAIGWWFVASRDARHQAPLLRPVTAGTTKDPVEVKPVEEPVMAEVVEVTPGAVATPAEKRPAAPEDSR